MKQLSVAIIGTGFIGRVHLDAIRRIPGAKIVALCDQNEEDTGLLARQYRIPSVYRDYNELLSSTDATVIHNCTPNHLHYPVNKAALQAGKHVFSEKPLTMESWQSRELCELALKSGVRTGVNFNYRMYPLIRQYRSRLARGELGVPKLVYGHFLQDWMSRQDDFNWRLLPQYGGSSRAVADIGLHWCDMAQSLLSAPITRVFASLGVAYPQRTGQDGVPVAITTEDYAHVLLQFSNGVQGSFTVSQVSPGHKCDLNLEVATDRCSFAWSHQRCNEMWVGRREESNSIELRGQEIGSASPGLPAGHPEGFSEAFQANIASFYNAILHPCVPGEHADFAQGHQAMVLLDAILQSAREERWVPVKSPEFTAETSSIDS